MVRGLHSFTAAVLQAARNKHAEEAETPAHCWRRKGSKLGRCGGGGGGVGATPSHPLRFPSTRSEAAVTVPIWQLFYFNTCPSTKSCRILLGRKKAGNETNQRTSLSRPVTASSSLLHVLPWVQPSAQLGAWWRQGGGGREEGSGRRC